MNKTSLALELSHLLELKIYHRNDKAYEIVKKVFSTIVDALWRGERVIIDGFGIFEVRTKKATRSYAEFPPPGFHKFTGRKVLIDVPERRYVIFKPAKPLLKLINS